MSEQFDLSWGHAVAVRSCFLSHTSGRLITFGLSELDSMNYPPHEGDERLIALTREIIERQVGQKYKHIILTNGATGGVTLALRAFAQRGCNVAFTRCGPYFPVYPSMIAAAGMKHVVEGDTFKKKDNAVALMDSPTNPQGYVVSSGTTSLGMPTIWDAVYHNRVYAPPQLLKTIKHDVLVGSYSKLTGLNGIRVGWIATDDDLLYERLRDLVTAEYCGLTSAGTDILINLLTQIKQNGLWEMYETNARYWLDWNREEWAKLEKFFEDGSWPVGEIGMFHYGHMDESCKKLFEKSNVLWMPGSYLGTNDEFARFNLGQDPKIIQRAVKEILKNDRI